MNDNKIVRTLWIGPILHEHQKACLNSFIKNGNANKK